MRLVLLPVGLGLLPPDEFEVDARHLFEHCHGLAVVVHPRLGQRLQILRDVHLPRLALRVADSEVVGGAVFCPPHALAGTLAALREPLDD